jgi:iron complex outermembrane receptor protein
MKTIISILIFFFGFNIIYCSRLLAQNPKSPQDTIIAGEEIEEVTITVFRSPHNLFNTPAPVNLILRQQLETGSALSPVEALNQVPGILVHHGTLNTNRLTIRGIGTRTPYATNKIKAYFGDIPLTTGDGETTLEDLENTAIQRVEIIKGPSSSLYGAGLAGVILFHPKTVMRDFVQNNTTVASFGTIKNTLSAGVGNNNLKIYASGSMLSSNAYRDNNSTERNNFLLNSMYAFSERANLQVLINATKMKAYIPSSLDFPTFQESPESAAANWAAIKGYEQYNNGQIGISFNGYTKKNDKISLAVFGSSKSLEELRPFNRLDEKLNHMGWRTYWQKNVNTENSAFTLTTGFEMFRENYDWSTFHNDNGDLLSDNKEKRQYENLYFQLESVIKKKLFLSFGLNGNLTRFYYTDYFLSNGDQSGTHNYKPILSPRLGANYVINDNLSVFTNVSHGFSTPSFEETLYPEGDLNENIQPETGWNYEAGFRSKPISNLQFTGSYYRIYVNDLLVARRTGEDAYVGVNAGKTLHTGLETELRWNVFFSENNTGLTLLANATFANYEFLDFVDEDIDYSGNQLPGTTKTIWVAGAIVRPSKNFIVNAWYRSTGEMPLDDANSGFSDGFGITNAELKYSGKKGKLKLEIKGGIQNIFNIHYASMLAVNAPSFGGNLPRYYYPGNPRNYYMSVLIGLVEK